MLIENFLAARAVTAIHGRPSMDQAFIADEVAFSVAAGAPLFGTLKTHRPQSGQVVIITNGPGSERNAHSRFAAWCAARGIDDVAEIVCLDAEKLRAARSSLNTPFFDALAERGVVPALVVSSTAATSPTGFYSPEAQAEITLAQYVIGRTGAAVLLAGHLGTPGNAAVLSNFDALWQVSIAHGHTALTQGDIVHTLIGREGGGHGHVVTRIFDAVKTGDSING